MAVDGYLNFDTKIDSTGFNKGTKSISNGLSGLKSSLLKVGAAVGVAFGVGKLVEFGKESSKVALTAEANVMRVRDIFGQYSQTITNFAKSNGYALGMSKSAIQQYAATYGNLFSTFMDSQRDNANMTQQYLNATAVVASKTGRTVEDVAERIRSGLLGNTEAIEDLGINVNIKTIEITDAFKRIANGRSWEQLNAYEQSQVRQLAILEQATKKYGTTVANNGVFATQKATAAIENLKNTIGNLLNKAIIPAIEWFTRFVNGINSIFTAIFGEQEQGQEQVTEQTEKSAKAQQDLAKQTTAAGKAASKSTASFDELNSLSTESKSSSATDSAGYNLTSPENSKNVVPPVSDKFKSLANNIKKSFNEIMNHPIVKWLREKFSDACIFANERIKEFKKFIDDLKQPLSDLVNNLDSAVKKIWEFWEPIADTAWEEYKNIMTAIDKAMQSVTASAINLANKFSELWQAIYGFLDSIGVIKMWQTQFSNIIRLASGVIQEFANWISEKVKGIEKKFGGVAEFLTGVFTGDWNKAFNGLKSIFDGFRIGIDADVGLFRGIFGKITGFLKETWNNASAFIKTVLGKVGEFFNALPKKLGYAFGQVTAKVVEWGANMVNWAKTKPKEIVDNIVKFFRDLPGKIKEVWNDVIDFLNKLPGKMINLGKNLLSGIWNGLVSAKDWLFKKISDFFGGFLDGFFDGLNLGKGSSANISPIPKLASGTVVPANYGEFLAVLGDNKRETEVVSPVSAIKQALKEAMAESGGNGGNMPFNITLKVGDTTFGTACINSINRVTRQTGELAIDLV